MVLCFVFSILTKAGVIMAELNLTSQVKTLVQMLDQVIVLLVDDGESHWANWLSRAKSQLLAMDNDGIDNLLGAYGGMGSFNDLVIGQQFIDEKIIWKSGYQENNDKLDRLRTDVYDLAKEIKSSIKDGQSLAQNVAVNHLINMKRINIIGTSGSGKSTFAKQLAELLSIKYIEMDALFWDRGWQGRKDTDFFSSLKDMITQDAWVLDGNYTRSTSIKWKNVDTVIWLDYSFWCTFMQLIKRSIIRIYTKKELWPGTGNIESCRQTFLSKESILLWMVQSFYKNRRKYRAIISNQNYQYIHFIRFTSPRDCATFLVTLKALYNR